MNFGLLKYYCERLWCRSWSTQDTHIHKLCFGQESFKFGTSNSTAFLIISKNKRAGINSIISQNYSYPRNSKYWRPLDVPRRQWSKLPTRCRMIAFCAGNREFLKVMDRGRVCIFNYVNSIHTYYNSLEIACKNHCTWVTL